MQALWGGIKMSKLFCCDNFKKLHWQYALTGNYINKDRKVQFNIKVGKSFGDQTIYEDITYCPFCGAKLEVIE
jgi:hypothetical protein